MNSKEVLDLLEWSGAIMNGHFKLTSGRHSNRYIEKFRLLENPIALDKICFTMSEKFDLDEIDLVAGAAIGGIPISVGVGRHLNSKHIFSERVDGKMCLKRGFNIDKKQNILIVEDIVTTGGSINEIIDLVELYDCNVVGIVSIVDRNDKVKIFKYPYETLLNFPVQSWEKDNCPLCKNNIPLTKPGSTGKK